jgi:hypothetical protein
MSGRHDLGATVADLMVGGEHAVSAGEGRRVGTPGAARHVGGPGAWNGESMAAADAIRSLSCGLADPTVSANGS